MWLKAMITLGTSLILSSCSGYLDARCYRHQFYCLTGENAEQYLRRAPDLELVEIAALDYETSMPPSGQIVQEMKRRGAARARVILNVYASSEPNITLLNDMVRSFSDIGDVCGSWLSNAPVQARSRIASACNRVLDVDQAKALRSASDPNNWTPELR